MHQQKLVPSQGSSTDYLCRHEAVRGHAQRFLRGANSKRLELGAQHSPPVRRTQNPVLARSIINGLARRRVRAGRSSVRGITGENCFRPGELARASAACAGEGAQGALPCGRPTPLRFRACRSAAAPRLMWHAGGWAKSRPAAAAAARPPPTHVWPADWHPLLGAPACLPVHPNAPPGPAIRLPRLASLRSPVNGQSCPAQIRHATSSTTPCELLPPAVAGSAFFDR